MEVGARLGPSQAATSSAQKLTMSDEDFEPILIVGHPRSGTTLLATILNRHSQVAIPPETSFFLPVYRHRRHAAAREGTHEALLEYLRWIPYTIEYTEESIAEMFIRRQPTSA